MSEVLCNVLNNNKDDGLYLGMPVTVALTGYNTYSAYQTKIVYISRDRKTIHLLGTTNLSDGDFNTNRAYRWTATGKLNGRSFIVTDCMTPTSSQIMNYCSGYNTGFAYWLNDYLGSTGTGWRVYSNGLVDNRDVSNSNGAVPYIVVNL